MQPKIIELKQAPVVLVELPEGFNLPELITDVGRDNKNNLVVERSKLRYSYPSNIGKWFETGEVSLSAKHHKIIGTLSNLTEEQFAECVERIDQEHTFGYRDYTGFISDLSKARHSFSSLLESESVYTENPLGTEPTPENTPNYAYSIHARQWEQAQSRTIDPKRTVILLRKEDVKCK